MLITCEHGGNRIPPEYTGLFAGWDAVLATHRGFDAGALEMAGALASVFAAPLIAATVSRLLIDLNRSLSNPAAWSAATRNLAAAEKERIVSQYHTPYRSQVEAFVAAQVGAGVCVIHVSSHSFTPELDGVVRTADVGLLYDPTRAGELALAARWKAALQTQDPGLRVRRNYPYAGRNDGLTSALRRKHPAERYVGLELELNQALVHAGQPAWSTLQARVIASLRAALQHRDDMPRA